MAYWILKTEPSTYSFDQLERDRSAVWDGVTNPLALKHLREMHPGDDQLIDQTSYVETVVGMAHVSAAAYPDARATDTERKVAGLNPGRRVSRQRTLAEIGKGAAVDE